MKNKKTFIIASIIMIVMLCAAFTVKTFQNDTFYTVKIGESILEKGIDMKEHFTWHEGLDYTYPHWLFDIIIYKLHDLGGLNTLYVTNILVFIVIGIIFYFLNLKHNKSYFLSLLFSILAVIMLARFVTMRAQLITYLLFLLEIICIECFLKKGKKGYLAGLIIICILIANLHAAVWPFYFILMLPYLFEQLVAIIKSKFKNLPQLGISAQKITIEKNKYIKGLFLIFIISLPLGLLTPIGDIPYTYFIRTMMADTMEYIEEHKPLVLIENLFVIGYLAIMLIPLIFTKVKVKLTDLAMMGGLLFMCFLSIRHIALLAVIGMFYLCRLICNLGKIKSDKPLDYNLPWYGIVIVTITIAGTSIFVYNINYKEAFINENVYPVAMVEYMKENLDMDKVRLYNEYDFGSYLIYKDIPVFIDSRSDLYTKSFNHKTDIFNECMKITENYGRIFKKYNITHILIYKDTNLNQILAASSNYELVHRTGRFMLYEYTANNTENETKEQEV